jgi:hypothetical protein
LRFCILFKDAITGNSLELKGQTILIQTRSKDENVEEVNAREMAAQLSSCISTLNDDVKFDSRSGMWYDTSVLVVARPGSGKTWMMQQITHFMCESYLRDEDGAYKFVPVLISVQRVARLHRASTPYSSNGDSNEITNQTDALHFLEVILKWDYDEATVKALLDVYNARTLVVLLDGLDEASSLARMFETLGIFLAKSGNRVVMAGRPEGVASEEFYSKSPGWTLLDLPELSVEQQKAIAKHQIENIEGPFFDRFYAYQECRNTLDAAVDKCGIDMDEMHGVLSEIKCTKLKSTPDMLLSSAVLAEVELTFSDNEEFSHKKTKDLVKFDHFTVLNSMKQMYKRATLAKTQFVHALEDIMLHSLSETGETDLPVFTLKKPKCLLQNARRNGGFHNVTDIVQGTIVSRDWKQMLSTLKLISSSASMVVHDIHNGFKDPDFIRYRCVTIKMSIEVVSGESKFNHPVELQLHVKTLHSLLPSCEIPRGFFLEQDGLCGDEKQRMSDLKKCMDVVHAIGRTPVLLSVFLMYIKACTSKLSGEERDHTANVQTCPPMPSSLHFMYQEAMWGTLEAQSNDPCVLLKTLQGIAWDNMNNGA